MYNNINITTKSYKIDSHHFSSIIDARDKTYHQIRNHEIEIQTSERIKRRNQIATSKTEGKKRKLYSPFFQIFLGKMRTCCSIRFQRTREQRFSRNFLKSIQWRKIKSGDYLWFRKRGEDSSRDGKNHEMHGPSSDNSSVRLKNR